MQLRDSHVFYIGSFRRVYIYLRKKHTALHDELSSSLRFAVRVDQHVFCIAGDVHLSEEPAKQDHTSAASADHKAG